MTGSRLDVPPQLRIYPCMAKLKPPLGRKQEGKRRGDSRIYLYPRLSGRYEYKLTRLVMGSGFVDNFLRFVPWQLDGSSESYARLQPIVSYCSWLPGTGQPAVRPVCLQWALFIFPLPLLLSFPIAIPIRSCNGEELTAPNLGVTYLFHASYPLPTSGQIGSSPNLLT